MLFGQKARSAAWKIKCLETKLSTKNGLEACSTADSPN